MINFNRITSSPLCCFLLFINRRVTSREAVTVAIVTLVTFNARTAKKRKRYRRLPNRDDAKIFLLKCVEEKRSL